MSFLSLSDRNKSRIKTILYIAVPTLLLMHFVIIYVNKEDNLVTYQEAIEQNKIMINGLQLRYLIDNTSFIELRSHTAWADKIIENVEMENMNIDFKSENTAVLARADTGIYELQKILIAQGNIIGKLNEMNFRSKKEGVIIYDYTEGKGSIRNGVYVEQGNSHISADSADFDTTSEFINFKGKVFVVYDIGSS